MVNHPRPMPFPLLNTARQTLSAPAILQLVRNDQRLPTISGINNSSLWYSRQNPKWQCGREHIKQEGDKPSCSFISAERQCQTASSLRLVAQLFGFRIKLLFPLIVVIEPLLDERREDRKVHQAPVDKSSRNLSGFTKSTKRTTRVLSVWFHASCS